MDKRKKSINIIQRIEPLPADNSFIEICRIAFAIFMCEPDTLKLTRRKNEYLKVFLPYFAELSDYFTENITIESVPTTYLNV
jgi:hypothetical protein